MRTVATSIWRPVLGAVAVAGLLAGCEGSMELLVEKRLAPESPAADTSLRTLARAQSQDSCTAGAVLTSADPVATYGPGSIELVDRELLDPALADPDDDHKATTAIWARWKTDPRFDSRTWDRMAAGQVRCADGYLYFTLVLQDDGTDGFAPGVVRVTAGNGRTGLGGISADGDTVAIRSTSTDLVPGTTARDAYLYDVAADELTPLGADPELTSVALTPDGSTLYYDTLDTEDLPFYAIAGYDIATGATNTRYTSGGSPSTIRSTSSDGSAIGIEQFGGGGSSFSVNRTSGPQRGLGLQSGFPFSVSVSDDGQHAAAVSGDLAEVVDLPSGTRTTVASGCSNDTRTSETNGSSLSADGRYLAYQCAGSVITPEDTDQRLDVFVWDRTTGKSLRITSGTDNRSSIGAPSISDDGRFVAFSYERPGTGSPVGTYLWDRTTGRSTLVAPIAAEAAVSGDGSVVAFVAPAPGQTDRTRTDLYVWPNPAA